MTEDLRYPVGKFSKPTSYSDAARSKDIASIAELPANLRRAVAGLDEGQLNTPYRPDGWTVRQVVHHVADSHMNAYIRTRFLLTSDNPTIMPYPEAVWAKLADASTMPVDPSLSLLDGMHARWSTLLRSLEPAQFSRTLMHPENGTMTLDHVVAMYGWHSRHHTAHITGLRTRSGW
jgi:hypothetical protein